MTTTSKTRQVDHLVNYLEIHQSISPVEARAVFGIERLAARMEELKGVINYRSETRTDMAGKRYTRYFYLGKSKLGL